MQAGARMPRVLVIKSKQLLCNVWVYHHNPPPEYPGHFYSKRIIFYSDVVVRFFFKRTEGQYICGTKQFQNCQKNFLGLEKGEKAMFIFPILDFSLDLEDQILVWRRQASSRLRLKRWTCSHHQLHRHQLHHHQLCFHCFNYSNCFRESLKFFRNIS